MTQHDSDMTNAPIRVTVEDAAKLLGISVDAVRKRIERGTLRNEKRNGTRYVLLDDMTEQDTGRTRHDSDMTLLAESLSEQVDYLRKQLEVWQEEARRKDHIIAALTERIPELEPAREAPPEPRDGRETASDESGGGEEVGEEQEKRGSWWRRLFG
jgi:excisionase family DNA binding protein